MAPSDDAAVTETLDAVVDVGPPEEDPRLRTLALPLTTTSGQVVGDIVLRAKYVSASDLPIGTGPLLRLPTHWAAIHGHDKVFDTNVRLPGLSFTHRGADGLLPVDLAAIGSTPGHARLVTRLLTKAPGLCTSSARTRIKLTPEQVRKLK